MREVCKAGCSAMAISQIGTLTAPPFAFYNLNKRKS